MAQANLGFMLNLDEELVPEAARHLVGDIHTISQEIRVEVANLGRHLSVALHSNDTLDIAQALVKVGTFASTHAK